jgi:virulence-associated protein VapD
MYAIAFDLVVADTGQHRPKDAMRAYTKIGVVFTELA